jgi:hypothetical protein
MFGEMKSYTVGPLWPDMVDVIGKNSQYNDYADFVLRKSRSKNMDKLWKHFYSTDNYPEFYLGIVNRVAICKCPITEKELWVNSGQCFKPTKNLIRPADSHSSWSMTDEADVNLQRLKVENPIKGSIVTVEIQMKDTLYRRDFIFMGWVKVPVHAWKMKKGTTLMLDQKFIDGLFQEDKRYLKIAR